MNILLLFFAFPIATVILAIVLQKILKCPIWVALTIFAIFLIIAFAVFNVTFLVAVIAYTILAFLVAYITMLIQEFRENCIIRRCDNDDNCCMHNCECNRNTTNDLLTISSNCQNGRNGNLLTISSNGCNNVSNDLLTISTNCPRNCSNQGCWSCNGGNSRNINNSTFTLNSDNSFLETDFDSASSQSNNCSNSCNCNCNNNERIVARANIVPNSANNGRSGSFCGCYRRR